MIGTVHRLPASTFDAVAAGRFDGTASGILRAGQFSRHLLLVRGLVDAARDRFPGRRGSIDDALGVLAEAQAADPASFAAVVGYPYVGSWAAHTLQRIATGAEDAERHVGQLQAIAAAAAVRSGLRTPVTVPAPGGTVHLPTLGSAWGGSPGPATVLAGQPASVRFADRTVRIPVGAADSDGWHALRPIGSDGAVLDDLHAYRVPASLVPTPRLGPRQHADWSRLHRSAERRLVARSPAAAGLLPLLKAVTPLEGSGGLRGLSATSRHAFGSIVLTPPDGPAGFAATLAHELRHAALNALLDLVPLIEPDSTRRYYSPWRRDPRPLHGILHGAYAFLGVLEYWRGEGERGGRTGFELARTAEQVVTAIDTLERSGRLLPAGERFLAGLRRSLARDGQADVDEPAATAAHRAVEEHRLAWRLRHLRPDPVAVAELAAGWAAGHDRPGATPAATLAESTDPFVESGRTALLAHAAKDAAWVGSLRDRPEEAFSRWPDLLDGDLALATGDLLSAARRYGERIATAPDDLDAWSGLAVTSTEPIWSRRPELVQAVHRCLLRDGRPAPVHDLARWLTPLADAYIGGGSRSSSNR
ncbi:hypothetical protein Drose_23110 [Dactylosporangium roseum]|uniref:HEXXH motif domain-containing protein n=1 Tax=Dactylosporangium roseum TaxID=47989 RepID=A0ABY5YZ49_9ACTN|nr:HEXXH motif domain-containing protein [Dactylosporangium roseum]UWZ34138.1 hypothetical protein Drose_23110 [Dactylosporangium roseum]